MNVEIIEAIVNDHRSHRERLDHRGHRERQDHREQSRVSDFKQPIQGEVEDKALGFKKRRVALAGVI